MYFQNELKTNKRAVIYCRVSSEEQVKGYSLTIQEKLCREFVVSHGFELVEVFIEKGESAKTLDRTELNRMWNFCTQKKNDIQFIVAYKVDRIARNRHDYRELDVKRIKYGLRFRYVSEQFDDSPAGRFMEDMFANMAHFDNDVRTERSMSGMREAMRQGRYVWRAPIGYVNAIVDRKSNIIQTIHAPLILETFEEIESGLYSTDQVRRRMAKRGLLTKRGKPVTPSHFYNLVRNKIYAGWIEKFGEIHKGSFTPIVSQALFDVVQLRLNGKKNKIKIYNKENPDFPLRRFITNDEGKKLKGYWAKGRKKKYPFYSYGYKNTTIRKETLEYKFITFVNLFEFDGQYLEILRQNLQYHLKLRNKDEINDHDAIDKKVKEVYAQMHHYSENEFKGIIDVELLKIHMAQLKEELRELEKQKERLESTNKYDIEELLDFAKGFLTNLGNIWVTKEFEIKTRFQWFAFPEGLIFDNKNLRTTKICKLFKLKERIDEAISCIVPNSEKRKNTVCGTNYSCRVPNSELNKNTVSRTKSPPLEEYLFENKEYWEEIAEELSELKAINRSKSRD